MVRKLWALVLTAALLIGAVIPVTGLAATQEEEKALYNATRKSYLKSLYSSGRTSLAGYCGLMVSYQLWHMDINKYLETYDGNDQFDAYKDRLKTNGDYYISAYAAPEYTLRDALYEITRGGTRDAYNILVGFQWTDTAAGARYGHTCVINGILNGKVYFCESFYTSIGGWEGNVITCSIDEFAAYYAPWTRFEGVIWFNRGYAGACEEYGTDLIVRTRFDMQLRSQPCLVGQEDCKLLRSVAAGERLHVTAVMKNTEGELYYRVEDGEQVGYIVAQGAVLERTNTEDIGLSNLDIPAGVAAGTVLPLSGKIQAQNGLVGEVEAVITDQDGNVVLQENLPVDDYLMNLSDLTGKLDTASLEKGRYTLTVSAKTNAPYVREDMLDYSYETRLLHQQYLWVDMYSESEMEPIIEGFPAEDGWSWCGGTWHCYDNGKPAAGWVEEHGIRYYVRKDGTVTTGWAEVDGALRYFNSNGALASGWLSTKEGMRYCMADGTSAEGWQMIDSGRYYFEDGIMRTSGKLKDGEVTYKFQSDGKAIPLAK